MKAIKRLTAAAALAFATVSAVQAGVITSEYRPPSHVWLTPFNSPLTFTHDLRDQLLPGVTINSVSLSISLYDPTDLVWALPETVSLVFGGVVKQTIQDVSLFGRDYQFDLSTALLDSGLLSVSISAGCGKKVFGVCVLPQDVKFAGSVLSADITPAAPVQVPEPGTVLTLGLGLLALAALRSRA